jgi:hypothetical protein
VNAVAGSAYQAGVAVAVAVRDFVSDTIRAAESIVADATERRKAAAPVEALSVRKPPAKAARRTSRTRRRRRAS